MAFLRKGSIQNFKGGKTSTAFHQMLMYMPPGETHATQYSNDVHAFYITFSPAWWERIPKGLPVLQEACEYRDSLPSSLALRMYKEFQRRDSVTPLVLEGLALELLAAIARRGEDSEKREASRWLKQAQEYLHAYFMEPLSISAIASAVGVHPGHLMRGFRQEHGCTVGDYVRNLRVQTACRLIKQGKQSLPEIAISTGFSDQSHFCRTFKQITGTTPTDWQNRYAYVSQIQNALLQNNTSAR